MQPRRCGNCAFFIRLKDLGGSRNGLCDKFDYNAHSDSTYAKSCKGYKAIKYKREKAVMAVFLTAITVLDIF